MDLKRTTRRHEKNGSDCCCNIANWTPFPCSWSGSTGTRSSRIRREYPWGGDLGRVKFVSIGVNSWFLRPSRSRCPANPAKNVLLISNNLRLSAKETSPKNEPLFSGDNVKYFRNQLYPSH